MSYELHDTDSLQLLQDSLDAFHENKHIFVTLGIRTHFNIPKLYALQHYVDSIRLFGSADGYNTEISERLHIDFAKKAYRASNRCDYMAQMVTWLHQQEKMSYFNAYQTWYDNQGPGSDSPWKLACTPSNSNISNTPCSDLSLPHPKAIMGPYSVYKTASVPSVKKVAVSVLASTSFDGYHATQFLDELAQYLSDVSPLRYHWCYDLNKKSGQ